MTLTPKTHFAQFYLKVIISLPVGHKTVCDTGDEVVMKIHKKIKIDTLEIGTFTGFRPSGDTPIFCYNFIS